MRVMFLVYDISLMAGSEHIVTNVATWLSEKNHHEVTILTANLSNGAPAYPLPESVRLRHLGLDVYPRNKMLQVMWHMKAYRELKKVFANERDVVIIGSWSNLNILLGAMASHDPANHYVGWENLSYDSIGLVRRALRLRYYARLDTVVVLTEADRRRYASKGLANVLAIPVAYPFYPQSGSTCEAARVVSVGRLVRQKGFDYLIDVARRVSGSHRDWEFVVNGSGNLAGTLRRLAKNAGVATNVRFVARTEDIAALYTSASIYAMTSRHEGFPMVLLEAMACGLPCVSFDCKTGPSELITDGETGFLVELGDTAGFAERLELLMADGELRKRMGAAARAKVLEYSPERVFEMWNKLTHELVLTPAE